MCGLVVSVFIFIWSNIRHKLIIIINQIHLFPIEQHFSSSGMTLSDRFTMYQRLAAEKEIMKPRKSPEIHRYWKINVSLYWEIAVAQSLGSLFPWKLARSLDVCKNYKILSFFDLFSQENWCFSQCFYEALIPVWWVEKLRGEQLQGDRKFWNMPCFGKECCKSGPARASLASPPSLAKPLLFSCKRDICSLLNESEMWKGGHSVNYVVNFPTTFDGYDLLWVQAFLRQLSQEMSSHKWKWPVAPMAKPVKGLLSNIIVSILLQSLNRAKQAKKTLKYFHVHWKYCDVVIWSFSICHCLFSTMFQNC